MVVIPSYVFVHCKENERNFVLQQPGVLNFVYWLGKPAIVRDDEMMALQHFLDRHHDDKIELEEIRPGMKIRIEGGPLHDKEGVVINVNNKKARIELSGLGIALVANVHRSQIKQKGE